MANTLGVCSRCSETKPKTIEYFRVVTETRSKGPYTYFKNICRVCECEYTQEWKKKFPEKYIESYKKRPKPSYETNRHFNLLKKYGMSLQEFEDLFEKQNYLCRICSLDLKELPAQNAHVDHCHTTGKIRGILCNNCNAGLGHFKDNPKSLEMAIKYLKENTNG